MRQSFQFRVDEASAGHRLDDFLAARLNGLSRMRIAGHISRGACAVNGASASAGRRLDAGDVVEAEVSNETPNAMTPEPAPLEIVYEDDYIIVVVKPQGVLVHPTLGVKTGTLANALAYHLNRWRIAEVGLRIEEGNQAATSSEANARESEGISSQSDFRNPPWTRPGIVHRLDRDTSGLLVVAKTRDALSRLSQHFHRRLVAKRYVAVLCGRVGPDELNIDAPIGRDESARPRWRVVEGAKEAETRLRVVERRAGRTLVELEPVTGRTNQLRIHCAHAGHAIVGDKLYGGDAYARLCLHASRLMFRHPETNDVLEFCSHAPPEVSSALNGGL